MIAVRLLKENFNVWTDIKNNLGDKYSTLFSPHPLAVASHWSNQNEWQKKRCSLMQSILEKGGEWIWRGKQKTSTYQDITTPDGGDKGFQVRGSNEVTFTKAAINSAFFICKIQMRTYFFFSFSVILYHYTLVLGNTNYFCVLGKEL